MCLLMPVRITAYDGTLRDTGLIRLTIILMNRTISSPFGVPLDIYVVLAQLLHGTNRGPRSHELETEIPCFQAMLPNRYKSLIPEGIHVLRLLAHLGINEQFGGLFRGKAVFKGMINNLSDTSFACMKSSASFFTNEKARVVGLQERESVCRRKRGRERDRVCVRV